MKLEKYAKDYDCTLSIVENCSILLKMAGKEDTLEHVTKVSKTGTNIADKYRLDSDKINIACYLHDISAIIPKEDYIQVCETNGIEVLEI